MAEFLSFQGVKIDTGLAWRADSAVAAPAGGGGVDSLETDLNFACFGGHIAMAIGKERLDADLRYLLAMLGTLVQHFRNTAVSKC